MSFSKVLSELRAEKGISQKELAIKCNLSSQCISSLETGTRNPTGSTIIVLAKFFECSTDYLLGLTDDYRSWQSMSASAQSFSDEELSLIKKYRSLSAPNKKYLNQTIEILSDTHEQQVKIKRG